MKPILKNIVPEALTTYSSEQPNATWEELRNHDQGSLYNAIRKRIVDDQFRLCAYCECKISESEPLITRVEHFHAKSDISHPSINWALLWENMLGVCNGGDNPSATGYSNPLPQNLSCDSHKNHMVQKNKISAECEGWILNPRLLPGFPDRKSVV